MTSTGIEVKNPSWGYLIGKNVVTALEWVGGMALIALIGLLCKIAVKVFMFGWNIWK